MHVMRGSFGADLRQPSTIDESRPPDRLWITDRCREAHACTVSLTASRMTAVACAGSTMRPRDAHSAGRHSKVYSMSLPEKLARSPGCSSCTSFNPVSRTCSAEYGSIDAMNFQLMENENNPSATQGSSCENTRLTRR